MIKYYSPCKGICELKADVCTGCRRTIGEITSWTGLNTLQKHRILKRIKSPIAQEIERDLHEYKQSKKNRS